MGDKSPKSKQRNEKQKKVSQAGNVAAAKSKQDGQAHLSLVKGKK